MIAQVPRIKSVDFALEVELGQHPDWSHWHMAGFHADVPNAATGVAYGLINSNTTSGANPGFMPGAAATVKVRSSSANDDGSPAGTGARTLYLAGLDGSYNAISETITLDGATWTLSANSYLRINEAYCTTFGTLLTNEGNLDIGDNGGAPSTYYSCPIGEAGFRLGQYTVPAGKTLYIVNAESEYQPSAVTGYTSIIVRFTTSASVYTNFPLAYFHSGNAHKVAAQTTISLMAIARTAAAGTYPVEVIMSGFLHNSVD